MEERLIKIGVKLIKKEVMTAGKIK